VWTVLSDLERWPEWTASITSIERLDEGQLRPGSRAEVRQPRLRPATFVVTEVDPARGFTWVTRSGGVTATARHDFQPVPAGTRVTLAVEFTGLLGGLVGRLYGPLTRRYLRLEAEGLKARSEGR